MRTVLHIATVALVLSGCGTRMTVDPSLRPTVNQFLQDSQAHGVYVDASHLRAYLDPGLVYAASGKLETVGLCDMASGVVTISPDYWGIADQAQRENLVYHELGHCLLNRLHTQALGDDGLPSSIMYPDLLDPTDYQTRRTALVDELFADRVPLSSH